MTTKRLASNIFFHQFLTGSGCSCTIIDGQKVSKCNNYVYRIVVIHKLPPYSHPLDLSSPDSNQPLLSSSGPFHHFEYMILSNQYWKDRNIFYIRNIYCHFETIAYFNVKNNQSRGNVFVRRQRLLLRKLIPVELGGSVFFFFGNIEVNDMI